MIRIWDPATGKELRSFQAHQGSTVNCIAVSPDGKILASGGGGNGHKTLALWDLTTGEELFTLAGAAYSILSVAFSPDGKVLASGSDRSGRFGLAPGARPAPVEPGGCTVRLWDVTTGKELRALDGHTNGVRGLAFAPDGKRLASASHDGTIRQWDPVSGGQLLKLDLPVGPPIHPAGPRGSTADQGGVLSVAFSPDSKILATGGHDSMIRLLDAATGAEYCALPGHERDVETVAFSPDGRNLVSGGHDHTVRLWDLSTRKTVAPWLAHGSEVYGTTFSPDGKLAVSLGSDRTIRLWDTITSQQLRVLRGHTDWISCVAFSPDGRTVVSGSQDQTIRFWNVDTGKRLSQIAETESWPLSLAFSPDGKILAFVPWRGGRHSGVLRLWDLTLGKELRRYTEPPQKDRPRGFRSVQFADDGKTLLVVNYPSVLLLDAKTTVEIRRFDNCFGPLAWSPDNKLFATGTGEPDQKIRLCVVATGKDLYRFSQWGPYSCVAFSPDGKMLASSNEDKIIRLWEVATGQLRRQFEGHQGRVRSLAFAPDGRRLISGNDDTTMLIWDVTDWPQGRTHKLLPKDLQAVWSDLSRQDGNTAHRAIWTMAAVPEQTVPFLQQQVRPVAATSPERIEQLVAELDSARFAVRQQAMQELEKLGELAQPILRKSLAAQPTLEARQRVERLVDKLDGPLTLPAPIQGLRTIEVLEHIGTPGAKQVLQTLATGVPEARLTREAKASLERLAKRRVDGR
jgi:WD40 repeat protein